MAFANDDRCNVDTLFVVFGKKPDHFAKRKRSTGDGNEKQVSA